MSLVRAVGISKSGTGKGAPRILSDFEVLSKSLLSVPFKVKKDFLPTHQKQAPVRDDY